MVRLKSIRKIGMGFRMNIENMKQARQWVKETPAKDLDMSDYYGVRTKAAEKIIGAKNLDAVCFLSENGWLPCGTVCCLAGLIHWNAATKKQLTDEFPGGFAQEFLGLGEIDALRLFTDPEYYGRRDLSAITKKDILRTLDEVIERGHV